jgi:hypothetical protein
MIVSDPNRLIWLITGGVGNFASKYMSHPDMTATGGVEHCTFFNSSTLHRILRDPDMVKKPMAIKRDLYFLTSRRAARVLYQLATASIIGKPIGESLAPRNIVAPSPSDLMPSLSHGDFHWWRSHGGISAYEGYKIVAFQGIQFWLRVLKYSTSRLRITTSPAEIMKRYNRETYGFKFCSVDPAIYDDSYPVHSFRNVALPDDTVSHLDPDYYLIVSPKAAEKFIAHCKDDGSFEKRKKRVRFEDEVSSISSSSDNEGGTTRPAKKLKTTHAPDPNQTG